MTERTISQIKKAARNKGANFEQVIARGLRPWWPEARRSRDNGSRTTSDTGDISGTGPGLFWSLKAVNGTEGSPPGLILAWMLEARLKAGGRLPLLVQKRKGHADPMMSWCWLDLDDLVPLRCDQFQVSEEDKPIIPVRMTLRDVVNLLAESRYTNGPGL